MTFQLLSDKIPLAFYSLISKIIIKTNCSFIPKHTTHPYLLLTNATCKDDGYCPLSIFSFTRHYINYLLVFSPLFSLLLLLFLISFAIDIFVIVTVGLPTCAPTFHEINNTNVKNRPMVAVDVRRCNILKV